ncbi:11581_t:CDS:2, partial [Gigaspora margarita]
MSNLRARILKKLYIKELNEVITQYEDAIIKVGKKILPSKVITNELREQRSEPKELRDMKAIKTLSILIGEIRKNRGS